MFGRTDGPFERTGTTSPIFVPRGDSSRPVRAGEYFWIRVQSAQAAFRGNIFSNARQLLVTSRINLNHPALGNEEVFAIQRSREVKRNRAEQLGLSSNLISLVPATMTHVSISIEYVLDLENHLAKLGGLINDDGFLTVLSLAPGAAAVAKTVGTLAQKVIQSFIPAEERKPILQFTGDFALGGGEGNEEGALRDGYYAILGSRDPDNPLPNPLPQFEVRDVDLLAAGKPVTQLSYIVLEVTRLPVRTRTLSENALWDTQLRRAEALAQQFADDPFADPDEGRETWRRCKELLQGAHTLLLADPNYVPAEADNIYRTVYKAVGDTLRDVMPAGAKAGGTVDTPADRAQMAIGQDVDLAVVADEYSAQVEEAQRILDARAVLDGSQ